MVECYTEAWFSRRIFRTQRRRSGVATISAFSTATVFIIDRLIRVSDRLAHSPMDYEKHPVLLTRNAERELWQMFRAASKFYEGCRSELNKRRIDWTFIPSSAPHFGELWEAGIKSTKYHLRRVIGCWQEMIFVHFFRKWKLVSTQDRYIPRVMICWI